MWLSCIEGSKILGGERKDKQTKKKEKKCQHRKHPW